MTDGFLGILLVEDDRQLSRAVSRQLRRCGFDVVAAPTAAMARVLECRFRLGIFDIDLGDESGIDLARAFLDCGSVEQVVFFSASVDAEALARAAEMGPVVAKREGVEALLPVLSGVLPENTERQSGFVSHGDIEPTEATDRASEPDKSLADRRRVS
jgi:DNA-binding response OmpR family regulator